jgi:hypothetical protein
VFDRGSRLFLPPILGLTAIIPAPLLFLKLLVLTLRSNNARRHGEAEEEDMPRGFAKKCTLATGTEKTENNIMHTIGVRLKPGRMN